MDEKGLEEIRGAVNRGWPLGGERFKDQIAARRPFVMPIVLHSFVLGQAYRARQFSRVVEHILRQRDKIWVTRPGDICAHIESLPKGIVPGSRV